MKILYHIPYPKALGADRWLYEGWRDAFRDLGYEFYEYTATDSLQEKLETIRPHIFMSAMNLISVKHDLPRIEMYRKQGMKFFLWIHWPADPGIEMWNTVLTEHDVADIYFGEREPEGMGNFSAITGKIYYTIPNAANKKMHFPVAPVKKYQYDIVFLGAKLPLKQQLFAKILKPLRAKYRVGVFGPGWTTKDTFLRILQKLARKIKIVSVANYINTLRISVPPEEERELYSSAKICLNFHEREPDGSQPHYILNQRTFKIPACGGFELCDPVPAIRRYFTDKEVILATMDPTDWFEKIDYYLTHEAERKRTQEAGTKRALQDHTYHERVKMIIDLYQHSQAPE